MISLFFVPGKVSLLWSGPRSRAAQPLVKPLTAQGSRSNIIGVPERKELMMGGRFTGPDEFEMNWDILVFTRVRNGEVLDPVLLAKQKEDYMRMVRRESIKPTETLET